MDDRSDVPPSGDEGSPPADPPPVPSGLSPSPPPPEAGRRLLRSRRDRIIAGVCGGLGHYLGTDPVWIRVATVLVILVPGIGIFTVGLAYLIAMIVIPEEPAGYVPAAGPSSPVAPRSSPDTAGDRGHLIIGGFLVALGGILLARLYLPEVFTMTVLGPLVLIAVGLLIVLQGVRR